MISSAYANHLGPPPPYWDATAWLVLIVFGALVVMFYSLTDGYKADDEEDE